ncbi:hypothetical protein [Leucobacter musarum]|uniref:hypothetical protein n=1 Tax=Leucobacter musarum TaxID=1930747 RepID=UPI0006A7C86C|nr:hypothetical protein [Leucobacter musarum]
MTENVSQDHQGMVERIEDELRATFDREPFADEIAERYIAERLAAVGGEDALRVASEVMAMVERLDISDLVARMDHDSSGNPIVNTPEQRRAQAVWSVGNELTQRAATWQRIFARAVSTSSRPTNES